MINVLFKAASISSVLSLLAAAPVWAVDDMDRARIEALVNDTIAPLMAEQRIPGMAVALSVNGKRHEFSYGVADQATGQAVTPHTLFELGSISKLLTATLAARLQASGAISLDAPASQYLTALEGTAFDDISLLELGTYTAGGLPLQFPDEVQDEASMIDYYRNWQPEYAPGHQRLYSNPSIGLLGYLTAQRLSQPFEALMSEYVFTPLGLESSYFQVPDAHQADYAFGYSKEDAPIRVNPGMLDAQAYGVKSTAADVLTLVEANMEDSALEAPLRQALADTRAGYFSVGDMAQGLGWESYAYPLTLEQLLAGNSLDVILAANRAERLSPPLPPRQDALYNKTGSTNGFGGYVAFIPGERLGIVMLANRNYPNQARIEAAYHILTHLAEVP
ncbi:beta-lactamase [Halomonas aquamarina]|uniref:Beta-lactamase n=1 Tax=Vreelandella aquamarina TaxID=77097 RepID=A0ACC5VY19_9GAMM|nr:class C beta-lactamase [Halomonas aquamarina]MBZ5488830.1 beta-lactamase [Halomonas aquamarina]